MSKTTQDPLRLDAAHLRSLRSAMNMLPEGVRFNGLDAVVDDLFHIHQRLLGIMSVEALEARAEAIDVRASVDKSE